MIPAEAKAKAGKKKQSKQAGNKSATRPCVPDVFDERFTMWSPEDLGGKGSNLMRCLKAGFRVPPFIVIGTKVLRTFPELKASLSKLDEECAKRAVQPATLAQLRAEVLKVTLPSHLLAVVQHWMREHAGSAFAVRSSGVNEDTSSAAFAGLYETVLNCRTEAAVKQAILQCLASQFNPSVWAYANHLALHNKVGMAVVVQVQIDSRVAGVAFSHNPVDAADDNIVIEGAYGQGEGVVSGEVTPDSWRVRRTDGEICRREVGKKVSKRALAPTGGLQSVALGEAEAAALCMSDKRVLELAKVVRELEMLRDGNGVDVEWCIDMDGRMWVVQARDITTVARNVAWEAPGEGSWFYDPVHFPGVMSTISRGAIVSLSEAMGRSCDHVGALVQTIHYECVNGVCFEKVVPRAESKIPEAFARSAEYMAGHKWLEDWKTWTEVDVPQRQARQMYFKEKNLKTMTNEQLADHLRELDQHWKDSFLSHHKFSIPALLGLGFFLVEGARLSGSEEGLLELYQAAADDSRGPMKQRVVAELQAAFAEDAEGKQLLEQAQGAEGLAKLTAHPGRGGQAVAKWLHLYDHIILAGYDATSPTYGEVPQVVLQTLRGVLLDDSDGKQRAAVKAKVAAHLETILARCKDDAARAEFRKIYEEALITADWCDQRGLYNDAQASGLMRMCLREVFTRLPEGRLPAWDWLLDCRVSEILEMLLAQNKEPSVSEVRSRRLWRLRPASIPPTLGPPPQQPPDPSGLPPGPRELQMALGTVMSKIAPEPPKIDAAQKEEANTLRGKSGNPGVATATARVLLDPSQWSSVRKGDIAVVQATNASFMCLLPLLSAIVTDYGGLLTHACICAREFGIPCVVATFDGTRRIKDGQLVTVDGTMGTVLIHK